MWIILRKSLRFYAIYKLMLCITGIKLSVNISLMVYSSYRVRKQRDSVVFKWINIADINIEKIVVLYVSSTTPTVQICVQCNKNSTRFYENLSVSKLVKTAITSAIEYLRKAENESWTQHDLQNNSKVNKTCWTHHN
jgi:hypothetical protein